MKSARLTLECEDNMIKNSMIGYPFKINNKMSFQKYKIESFLFHFSFIAERVRGSKRNSLRIVLAFVSPSLTVYWSGGRVCHRYRHPSGEVL